MKVKALTMKIKSGFTLLEVVLALVVLAVAVVGTSGFFYANRRNLHNARVQRQATWAAVERMEEYRGTPYPDLEDGKYEDAVELGDITAQRTATVETVNEGAVTYKQLTVEVNWGDQTLALATYISD